MRRSVCAFATLAQFAQQAEAGFSFFDSLTQKASTAASSPTVVEDIDGLSEPASEIVGGTIDAFLGGSDISWSERRCLSNGASNFATSLTEACDEALKSYKQFTQPPLPPVATAYQPVVAPTPFPVAGAPLPAFAPLGATTPQPVVNTLPTAPVVSRRLSVTQGEEAVISMELLASLSNLYRTQTQVAKSCLKDDVVTELQDISDHLTNVTYVGERLVANGMDIVGETSKAFDSYEKKNYRSFGKDMGTVWREVLLSKPDGGSFRTPSTEAIQEATDGLFSSLLGRGFTLQVTSDSAAQTAPAFMTATVAPQWAAQTVGAPAFPTSATVMPTALQPTVNPSEVDVDLHDCIVGNMPLWQSAWTPVFEFVSAATTASADAEPPEMSDLMVSFMDVQLALQRCDIDAQKEAMLIDTFESGGKFKTKLNLPDHAHSGAVPSLLATALEDFKERNWHAFGSQLGKAMQSMVVVSFPQEYEIDDAGRLHKIVIEATEMGERSPAMTKGAAVASLFGLVAVVLSVLAVAIRRRTAVLTSTYAAAHDYDLEAVE